MEVNKMIMYHGRPLSKTFDGNVLWEFPGGKTGIISMEDACYLCDLMNGIDVPKRRYIHVIQ